MFLTFFKFAFRIVRYAATLILSLIGLLILTNCTMMGLNYASLETANKPAAYPAITAITKTEWEAGRSALMKTFEDEVYGPWPAGLSSTVIDRRMVDADYLGGEGTLEELTIQLGEGGGARVFHLALALPKSANAAPAPIVIGQTFSSNCGVFPLKALTSPGGGTCSLEPEQRGLAETALFGFFMNQFGEFIREVPMQQYFDRGYGYANYYASEVVSDRAEFAPAEMAQLISDGSAPATGALMAWAYAWSASIDALESDPRIDAGRVAIYGHSRHAKAALLAGVFDRRVAAVLSHQSGYGGAASSRATVGEGIRKMIEGVKLTPVGPRLSGYTHWFTPSFSDYADRVDEIPVDQHQLLALIAPTPLYLGNGRRDVWSDPNSTYVMASEADKVYELYGLEGLNQDGLRDYNPQGEIAFFMRGSGHGTRQPDVTAMLSFLDAHLGDARVASREAAPDSP